MTRKANLVGILVGVLTVAIFFSVSVAVTADLHPDGYDENCNLCQITKSPLVVFDLHILFYSCNCFVSDIPLFQASFYQEFVFPAGRNRAPPSLLSFSK